MPGCGANHAIDGSSQGATAGAANILLDADGRRQVAKAVREVFARTEGVVDIDDSTIAEAPRKPVVQAYAGDGKVTLTDERTFRVFARPNNERLFDFEITIKAPADSEVVLGDTKEGSMAIRLNETMRLKPNKENAGKPTGHIVNSEGVRDGATWGKRAAWCDYYGPVEGKTVGVAIFDHPQNPRYPTWWHVRDYGLFAANPFGQHDFEKLDNKTAGTIKISDCGGKRDERQGYEGRAICERELGTRDERVETRQRLFLLPGLKKNPPEVVVADRRVRRDFQALLRSQLRFCEPLLIDKDNGFGEIGFAMSRIPFDREIQQP